MSFVIAEDTYAMYFVNGKGKIVTNSFIVEDGDSYTIISKSKVGKNGIDFAKKTVYYAEKSGKIATDKKVTVGSYKYTFDEDGIITKKAKVK